MLEKLKKIMSGVSPESDFSQVTLDTKLVDDLHFDSLGMMMFALAIEDELGVYFVDNLNFVTVKDVIDYIEANSK